MQITTSLNLSPLTQDKDCSMLKPICNLTDNLMSSVIAESVLPNKEMTLLGKSKKCKNSIPRLKSSKTSVVDLTSKEKDLMPYWTDYSKVISSTLWLPTVTALQDLDLNSLNILSNKMVGKSWFSIKIWENPKNQNLPKTYWPSFITSLAPSMVEEVIKAKKIRIYPSIQQKQIFRQWFGTSRKVYNETVNHLNLSKEQRQKHWMGAAKIILASLPDWAKEIPYQVKKIAVEDAYKAFSNGIKKFHKENKPFELQYRSRKDTKQSCYIPSSALLQDGDSFGIYKTITNKLKVSENLPKDFKDSRLIYEHGRWFVIVPYKVKTQSVENQNRIVSLDPGIRTFLTGFADNCVFKIGEGDFSRIAKLCKFADKLLSKIAKAKCRQKQRMRKALSRLKYKIWDLTDELHNKSIKFLLDNFDMIILPKFNTSEMVSKSKRKIKKETVRNMLTFSFYKFSQKLENKAVELNKKIVRISEAYTSKTVSWTGEIKNIGSSKIIKSNQEIMDRDINGARGIYLRAMCHNTWIKAI